jgi:hypothetical protein
MFKLNVMKQYFILFSTILVFAALTPQSQFQLIKDNLIKKNIKNPSNSGYYIQYSDVINSTENLNLPKDNYGQTAELTDTKLNSPEKLDKIASHIFDSNQIKYLAANKCYISCIVSSTGKINSASVTFFDNDPDVQLKQLAEFSKQIRENLTVELSFDRDIKEEGYISLSFPAFPILMTPKFLNAKP